MGFSRQEYWRGLPLPSPRGLPEPRIKPAAPVSPAQTGGFFITVPPGTWQCFVCVHKWAALWLSWWSIRLQCRRPGFHPWAEKIPWRRERPPTPVLWPGEFCGLCSPWGCKESDTTEWLLISLSVAQMVKTPPTMQETRVQSLGMEDLEKEMAAHSSILARRIPWTEGVWWATVHRATKSWMQLSN